MCALYRPGLATQATNNGFKKVIAMGSIQQFVKYVRFEWNGEVPENNVMLLCLGKTILVVEYATSHFVYVMQVILLLYSLSCRYMWMSSPNCQLNQISSYLNKTYHIATGQLLL